MMVKIHKVRLESGTDFEKVIMCIKVGNTNFYGKTPEEVIGRAIVRNPESFGIEIEMQQEILTTKDSVLDIDL